MDIQQQFQKLGQEWLKGGIIREIDFGQGKISLFEPQIKFLNDKHRYCLYSGGYGSGKSLALLIKMILMCLCFPKNQILLGRKTLQDLDRTTLPQLFELLPPAFYHHRIKEGLIKFKNGSQIILFGLEALQEGSVADIKAAQQKVKSLNLGGYFIDQLEEVEKAVFESLNARLRRTEVPIRQGNMTTNPANFWAYQVFKVNPTKRQDISLVEGSMLDNREHLPSDYLDDQLNHDERYVKRYVYGIWSPDVLFESVVFAEEYIKKFEAMKRKPIAVEEGCEIWEQPKAMKCQMGIDPSEGSHDPSSISVISEEGKKVAKYNGLIPIPALIEKTKFLYYKYQQPLIVPEVNASGIALLEGIKDLKVYQRIVLDVNKWEKGETKKLGWKTSYQSKQALISNFVELLRQGFPQIYDHDTIEEFKTFVWSDSARQQGAGGQRGFFDDNVISTLLGYWQMSPQLRIERIRKIRREREKIYQIRLRGRPWRQYT